MTETILEPPGDATPRTPPPLRIRRGTVCPGPGSDARRDWPVWLVAGTTFLSGALSILEMLFEHLQGPSRLFTHVLPFGLHFWGRSLTLIFGFTLIYLSLNSSSTGGWPGGWPLWPRPSWWQRISYQIGCGICPFLRRWHLSCCSSSADDSPCEANPAASGVASY